MLVKYHQKVEYQYQNPLKMVNIRFAHIEDIGKKHRRTL